MWDHPLCDGGGGGRHSALGSCWGSSRSRRAGVLQLHIMQVHRGGGGVFPHSLVRVGLVWVVPAHMLHHLELLLGLVAAEAAEEGVPVGVGEGMMAQAGGPAESTVAHVAHVGLGFTVLAEVGAQQEASLEGLAALLTHEGPCLPVPSLLVHAQRVGPVGAILALGALVWLQAYGTGQGQRTKSLPELVEPRGAGPGVTGIPGQDTSRTLTHDCHLWNVLAPSGISLPSSQHSPFCTVSAQWMLITNWTPE